jgi:hypothetical protein
VTKLKLSLLVVIAYEALNVFGSKILLNLKNGIQNLKEKYIEYNINPING